MGGKGLLTYTDQCWTNNTLNANNNDYYEFTIPTNHSTTTGDLYYDSQNGSMKGDIGLLYKTVNETDEGGNGNYDFYYGDVVFTILDDIGDVSVYCYYHGYMGGKNLITYTDQCYSNVSDNNDDFYQFTVTSNHSTTTGDLYYDSQNGSMKGDIGLLYKTVNETDEGGNGDYDFYYGNININVLDDFEKMSVYCYYHGYMGGKDLMIYAEQCNPNINNTLVNNDYFEFTIDKNHNTSEGSFYYFSEDISKNIHFLHKTIYGNTVIESGDYDFYYGDIKIIVNEDFGDLSIYTFNEGNINENTLLKYTNQCATEDLIEKYTSTQPSYHQMSFKISEDHNVELNTIYYQVSEYIFGKANLHLLYREVLQSDEGGNGSYDFYYGDILVNVNGNFGKVSIYNFDNGYLGTKDILNYTEQCNLYIQEVVEDDEEEEVEETVEEEVLPKRITVSSYNDTSETNAQWYSRRVLNKQFFPNKRITIENTQANKRQTLESQLKLDNFR